ncbi:MAG: CDP-diglyceride synthetase [Candidatus Poriferisodalaceae bacterium]|jgi:CDP-diglyceride synthetase
MANNDETDDSGPDTAELELNDIGGSGAALSDEPTGPLLSFDAQSSASLPHWSDPATGELPVLGEANFDELAAEPSGSRLFPQLPDDQKMVDGSAGRADGFSPVGDHLPRSVDELFGDRRPMLSDGPDEPVLDPTGPMDLDELEAAGIVGEAVTVSPEGVSPEPVSTQPAPLDPPGPDPDTTIIRGLGDEEPAQMGDPLGFDADAPDFELPRSNSEGRSDAVGESADDVSLMGCDSGLDIFGGEPSAAEPSTTGILEVVGGDATDSPPIAEDSMDDEFPQAPDVSALFDDDDLNPATPLGDPAHAGMRHVAIDPLDTGPIGVSPLGSAKSGESEGAGGAAGAQREGLDAWATLDGPTPHWREGSQDYEERGRVQEDERAVLHFDDRRGPGGDDGDEVEEPEPSAGRNVPVAIAVGFTLAAAFFFLLSVGPAATMVLVVLALVLAASEFFQSVRNVGYRPAILLGLASVAGLTLAAYWKGTEAYPLVFGLLVVAGLIWFLLGVEAEHSTANLAITMLGVGWIGVLGSFAALILRQPSGDAVLIGAVVGTVAYDVGGYIIGSTTGQSRLAPHISPNKTYEGLIGGMILSVLVTTVVLSKYPGIHPWENMSDALWFGIAIAVMAPTGDLAQSMIKRDLGVKDMGTLLPGHGGVFDRFDALLFVLPAAYYVSDVLNIASRV